MEKKPKRREGEKINQKFSKFTDAVINANIELFELIHRKLEDNYFIHTDIGAGGDRSSGIDLIAEEIFIRHLGEYGQIISEESGVVGTGECKIIVDPIDGSDNFLSKLPYYGTSIALEYNDAVEIGIVANLANGDLFVKTKEHFQKTKLDRIDFQDVDKHPYATIGIFERAYKSEFIADKLKKAQIKYRAPGALALSLAYAHDVNFMLYEGKARDFDIKAGLFMCEDLYRHIDDRLILIAKDKEIFNNLKRILLGE